MLAVLVRSGEDVVGILLLEHELQQLFRAADVIRKPQMQCGEDGVLFLSLRHDSFLLLAGPTGFAPVISDVTGLRS